MPLVLPTSFFNASHRWSLAGSSHGFSMALAGQLNAGVDPDQFAQDLSDAFEAGYDTANMYNQWFWRGVHVLINTGAGISAGDFDPVSSGTGGGADTSPPNCCITIQKHTGFAGVANRGRMYMPPISLADPDVDDTGIIDAGVLSTIRSNVDSWLATILTTVTEVDAFFLLHEQVSPGPGTPTEITSFTLDNLVSTQRRRLR